ncbi:UNVERIFIED_CONTAM: hypothetical protein RMT77_004861 [Armadillidium vulgare]
MSRHVPLTCRDPFFRDLDREFFGDRTSSRREWFDSSPSKLFDQHFGAALFPDDTNTGTSSIYLRSRRPPREKSGVSYVNHTKEKYSVLLDVPHFTPDELKVRVTGGNVLEVEGKHEERNDEHGSIARHFVRKYYLPEDVMVDMLTSSLGVDGVLAIEAPKKPPEPPRPSEREVPIQKMDKGGSTKI